MAYCKFPQSLVLTIFFFYLFYSTMSVPEADAKIAVPERGSMDQGLIATANAIEEIPALVNTIVLRERAYVATGDDEIRVRMLESVRSLLFALETPREAMIRTCWWQV